MSKAADLTRADLLDAAVTVFAEKGFDAGSVREIARIAGANIAAVSYHFGGKDALYREVLRRSAAAFDMPSFNPATVASMSREDAVRTYITAQLSALRRHDEVARYLRIFAWETLTRTAVFADFLATERLPVMDIAAAIVRRYLGHAGAEANSVALLWLLYQVEPFIRNPQLMVGSPFDLKVDAPFVARLADTLSTLVVAGLESMATRYQPRVAGAA